MTKAQEKVVARLRELGGAAWLGDGFDKANPMFDDLAQYVRRVSAFFGKREGERLSKRLKKLGVGRAAVWCSSITFSRLLNAGIIEPNDVVPGLFKLTKQAPA